MVVLLLVASVLVVLARVGPWQQTFVSDRVLGFFAGALAAVFLAETLAAFTWSRDEPEWRMYGPVSFVIAVLALVIALGGAQGLGEPEGPAGTAARSHPSPGSAIPV